MQIQKELDADGYRSSLGEPFWWPSYNSFRYLAEKDRAAQFVSKSTNDFYTTLQQLKDEVDAAK